MKVRLAKETSRDSRKIEGDFVSLYSPVCFVRWIISGLSKGSIQANRRGETMYRRKLDTVARRDVDPQRENTARDEMTSTLY